MATQFAKKIAIVTEIKNILTEDEIRDIHRTYPMTQQPWIIKDTIAHNFDNILSEVSKIKAHRNEIKKADQFARVHDAMNANLDPNDFIGSFTTKERLDQGKINSQIAHAKMSNVLTEDEIKEHRDTYRTYHTEASDFLGKYDYFKQYGNYCLQPHKILTGEEYLRYLTPLTYRMIQLATIISKERFKADSGLYFEKYFQSKGSVSAGYRAEGEISPHCVSADVPQEYGCGPGSAHSEYSLNNKRNGFFMSINFIPKSFEFPNKVEYKNVLKEFRLLVQQIYVLCHCVQDTALFFNNIMNNYTTKEFINDKLNVRNKFYQKMTDLRNQVRIEEANDCAKLPTSWSERIRYWFYNVRASDDTMIHSFSMYSKYLEFWFQSNAIKNGMQKFECQLIKDANTDGFANMDINFVTMLFGLEQ